MDMSLDEIIAKKKAPAKNIKKGFVTKKNIPRQQKAQHSLLDARNRIIQKNRHKIKDARDKIVEKTRISGDARIKLLKKAKAAHIHVPPNKVHMKSLRKSFPPAAGPTRRLPPPKVIPKPRGYIDYDNMERQEQEEIAGLRRTIQNDLLRGPRSAFPEMPFRDRRIEMEPFDLYHVPRRNLGDKPSSMSMDVDMDQDFPLDIHRSVRNQDPLEYSTLSLDMKNRLQNPPDVYGGSHGIFSNPLKKTISMNDGYPQGYRIVVSNLHNSVTESDIKELFQEIGDLYDARLVRTGVAEVVFKREKDALKAVEVYHNRQLDSLPMKCLLVNPRASDHPTAPALSSSSSHRSKKSSFEVDIDALHKVLFRRN